MKKLMNALVISGLCFLGSLTNVEAAKFDVALEDGKVVTLTGVIKEEPRKWVSDDGLDETYILYLAAGSGAIGDDYVKIRYRTLIFGYKVGVMTFKMGDRVTLSGRLRKAEEGTAFKGSININDYNGKELLKFPKK